MFKKIRLIDLTKATTPKDLTLNKVYPVAKVNGDSVRLFEEMGTLTILDDAGDLHDIETGAYEEYREEFTKGQNIIQKVITEGKTISDGAREPRFYKYDSGNNKIVYSDDKRMWKESMIEMNDFLSADWILEG